MKQNKKFFLIFLTFFCFACKEPELVDDYFRHISENNIPSSNFPVLFINTNDGKPITSRETYIPAKFSLTDINNDYLFKDVDIETKGRDNSSWTLTSKKGYNIKLDKKKSIFNMSKAKKWNIIANAFDKSLLRNWTAYYLGINIFTNLEWTPSCEFCDLFVNNEYRGNYIISESVEIADNKINIKDISKTENLTEGGFLLEIDARKDASYCFVSNYCNLPFALKDPDLDKLEKTAALNILNFEKDIIDNIEQILISDEFQYYDIDEMTFLDVNSFIDWYLLEEFAKNLDSDFYLSVYMYYNPETDKLYMGPIWDFDLSFGNSERNLTFNNGFTKKCSSPDGLWMTTSQNTNCISYYELLFKNKNFEKAVKQRWHEISPSLNSLITTDKQNNIVYQKAELLKDSAERNFKTWDVLGKKILDDSEGYQNRTSYISEVNFLIDWMRLRKYWLDEYFNY